jgi:uncharacterized membrane protein YvbJ
MKTCPSCHLAAVADNADKCPQCGHQFTRASMVVLAIMLVLAVILAMSF